MSIKMNFLAILFLIFFNFLNAQDQFTIPSPETINKYWYQQGAEISSFALTQQRYGETRNGYMVNIFVTEPFDSKKQVKADHPAENINSIKILKLNQVKKFNTGIYQYSLLTSSFTPFENKGASPMKVTCSIQEWCGHAFYQFNQKGTDYSVKGFSYFESEGDIEKEIKNVYLEDGVWNQIRINPNLLKIGEFTALPSASYLRMTHKELKEYKAIGSITVKNEKAQYSLKFPELNKTTEFEFEKNYPFKILSFTETYPDSIGGSPDSLAKNTAELKKTIYSFYWEKHKNIDVVLQKELLLDTLLK